MKKTLLMLVSAMFCLVGLNGCGDKDEPVETATATYQITLSDDAFASASYIIYYMGNNNEKKFESLTQKSWSKTVTSNKASAEFGFQIGVSTKDVSELTKENYDLSFTSSVHISRGTASSNRNPLDIAEVVAKNNVPTWLNNNLKDKSFGYRVDSKGEASSASLNLK